MCTRSCITIARQPSIHVTMKAYYTICFRHLFLRSCEVPYRLLNVTPAHKRGPKVRKNGGSELRSVLARLAHPGLLRAPTMDSLTQPTSLVWGANAEIGRKRTHRGRRSSEARIRRSLLRSSKRPFHREKRRQRHVDHPGSGAGDLVASREKDQSGGFGRLQAKRR